MVQSIPSVGSELGSYRIEALLGRGGMGVVFRAFDVRLDRMVALKVLPPELAADPRFRGRFLRESHTAASIDHPGIVPIYEAGEIDGLLFIAMRYVDGEDLGAVLRREHKLQPDRAVAIADELAEALDAAHARGLVHRDVKPSNVLLARHAGHEHVYLADFGITKLVGTEATATESGQLVGTVAYAAPELIRGDAVDARADVYSLGCMLHECLTGEVPFARHSDVATIYAHLEDPPPAVTQRRPELPAAIDEVVARALAKAPGDRWPTAGAFAAAAASALGASPAWARRTRRGRFAVAAAASGAVLLAAAATVALIGDGSSRSGSPGAIKADAVAVVDGKDGSLIAQVPVGTSPSHVAAGGGAVWVTNANDHSVSRIDPVTHTVNQTIRVGGGPSGIAVDEDGVWVANGDGGTVSRISPATNEVVQTIPVGNGPIGVCAGAGAVWVAAADDRTLSRIDPARGRVTGRIPLDTRPSDVACADGSVWTTSETSGTVSEIRPASGGVIRRIEVGGGASGLAVSRDSIWVANTLDGTVSRVDRRRGVVAATIPIGAGDGPSAIAIGAGGVWVSAEFAGTVVRIDPGRNAVATRLRVGNRPQGVAVVDGALWIGLRDSGAHHRGGTLRVVAAFPLGEVFDPATSYAFFPATVLTTAYDGLTAFRRVGGGEGRTVVPDLALTLPVASDRGRTYAFELRRGVRYSTGAPVRASDFRRGLERAMRAPGSPASQFFDRVVGASACARKPRTCDLSRGVVADDASGTVVFHLTAPDGDLLHKLALPFAAPMPPGTRAPQHAYFPPSTGPYKIDGLSGDGVMRLIRNPHFRPWSQAARPDGAADAITVQFDMDVRDALDEVKRGEADVTETSPGDARPAALRARYAGQVYATLTATVEFVFLNTRTPPFDDVDVRRALNYALDRRAAVRLEGGPEFAQAACQMLPSNFPGYRPYCPYTATRDADGAPELAKARRLVDRSTTRGMRVTVRVPGLQFAPVGRLVARTLRDLGYRASLHDPTDLEGFFASVQSPRSRVQIGVQKWGADYPAASTFLKTLFGCAALAGDPAVDYNWSRYCDARTELLMRRGLRLQGADDAAADAAWARADQRVVDHAAAVPLLNPKQIDLVSRRVGNHQYHTQWGVLLDQLWVR